MIPKGRAATPEQKAAVMRELLTAWVAKPELRLGQLISNALYDDGEVSLFHVEDERLAQLCRGKP